MIASIACAEVPRCPAIKAIVLETMAATPGTQSLRREN